MVKEVKETLAGHTSDLIVVLPLRSKPCEFQDVKETLRPSYKVRHWLLMD